MEHPDLAQVAAIAAAVGSALALLGRARLALLAGLGILAAAEAGLALSLGDLPVDRVATASCLAAAGAAAIALLASAAVLVKWPEAVPLAVLAAAPLRPPLDFDSSHRFLIAVVSDGRLGRLLPLYFVLAAAGVALAWRTLRAQQPARPLPTAIAYPAAAFFVLAFLSLIWAEDVDSAVNTLLFFTLPFAVLLAVLSRAPSPDWLPRPLAITGLALAGLFAAVGVWQAATHEVFFFAPNLQVANANTDFFRVTSLFGDPSLYGRHVVLGMCIALTALATSRIDVRLGVALLALMWIGLYFSYSQTSMATLLVVTLGLAVVTGDRRVRRAVLVAGAVVVVALGGYVVAKTVTGESLNHVTSDRLQRVEQTLVVVRHKPFLGVGIGGQPRASRKLEHSDRPTTNFASHTTPLTVAAELGIVGLALYAWLLVGGARLLASVTRLHRTLGLTLGAAFVALFAHALAYSGFLEDPLTWVVLALGAAWLTWRRSADGEHRPAGRPRAEREPEPATAGGS